MTSRLPGWMRTWLENLSLIEKITFPTQSFFFGTWMLKTGITNLSSVTWGIKISGESIGPQYSLFCCLQCKLDKTSNFNGSHWWPTNIIDLAVNEGSSARLVPSRPRESWISSRKTSQLNSYILKQTQSHQTSDKIPQIPHNNSTSSSSMKDRPKTTITIWINCACDSCTQVLKLNLIWHGCSANYDIILSAKSTPTLTEQAKWCLLFIKTNHIGSNLYRWCKSYLCQLTLARIWIGFDSSWYLFIHLIINLRGFVHTHRESCI